MARRNPWWIPPFLGRAPATIDDKSLNLLGIVSLALLFEEYDTALLTAALKQIAEALALPQEKLGLYLGLIRFGALPAFVLIPLADRIGRRLAFVSATTILGVLTFASAFVQSAEQFVWLQVVVRTFVVAGSAVAVVIVTEELPAEHRGWGMGMLAALGLIGHGLCAALFSQVERLPYGWRSLYALGIVPALMLPFFLKYIPETRRFRELQASASAPTSMWEPVLSLARAYPLRVIGVSSVGFVLALAVPPAFQFSGYYVQEVYGWSPGQYSLMVICAGAFGIVGNIAAGHMADRWGRRLAGAVLLSGFPLFAALFYMGGELTLWPAWVGLVFCSGGGRLIVRALSTELFPTSQRGSASGVFTGVEMLGAGTGLLLIYFFGTENVRDLGTVVPTIATLAWLAAAVMSRFPETSGKELEAISDGH